jgi:hypothetical protein
VLEDAGVGDHDVEVGDAVRGFEGGGDFAGGCGGGCVVCDYDDFAAFACCEGGELLCGCGVWSITDSSDGDCVWSRGVRGQEAFADARLRSGDEDGGRHGRGC